MVNVVVVIAVLVADVACCLELLMILDVVVNAFVFVDGVGLVVGFPCMLMVLWLYLQTLVGQVFIL